MKYLVFIFALSLTTSVIAAPKKFKARVKSSKKAATKMKTQSSIGPNEQVPVSAPDPNDTPINPNAKPGPADPGVPVINTNPAVNAEGQPIFLPRPNVGAADNNSSSAGNIVSQFLNMLGGGAPSGTPKPYTSGGQYNPSFTPYLNKSENFQTGDGFVPSDAKEIKQEYKSLCNYPVPTDASRFSGHYCSRADRDRMTCMVCNIYYEANDQPLEGQVTVGRSVLTRLFSGQYAGRNDGTCAVVYRNNGRVAQYSWTFERKNHTLPAGPALNRTIEAARRSFCEGPNNVTNYFAQALVNPAWNSGECARTRFTISGHTFCRIGGKPTRTIAEVMAAEGFSTTATQESAPQDVVR